MLCSKLSDAETESMKEEARDPAMREFARSRRTSSATPEENVESLWVLLAFLEPFIRCQPMDRSASHEGRFLL